MIIPELISQFWMLSKKLLCCNPFEDLNDISRGKYWMSIDEEMNVIGHDFLIYQ